MFTISARLFGENFTPLELLKLCGFEPGGRVQRAINEAVNDECKKAQVIPASPDRELEDSFVSFVDEGLVAWNTAKARYLYHGVLVTDEKGRTWVGAGETKPIVHPDRPLKFDTSQNGNAGAWWFERMKADRKQNIIDAAMNAEKRG